jgi:hypothetical protein
MFRLLLTRLLREFVMKVLTPDLMLTIINWVLDAVKAIAPDVIDERIDKIDRPALANKLLDRLLGLILPGLPLVVGGDDKPIPAAGVVAVDEADKDIAEIVAKVNASIAAG